MEEARELEVQPERVHPTTPRPFVFVLMPFEKRFNDIYTYGIKGAADDVGAYAERLDEQVFTEGMLERIFNQINKADVIVADMTGRNPNVFYEVGYAHALGKTVILLTQEANDIPFDLKHRQHTVYEGEIETLRKHLATKLKWAIRQSLAHRQSALDRVTVRLEHEVLRERVALVDAPEYVGTANEHRFDTRIIIRNDAVDSKLSISHSYLFATPESAIVPRSDPPDVSIQSGGGFFTIPPSPEPLDCFDTHPEDSFDGLTQVFPLPLVFTDIPPRAFERGYLRLMIVGESPLAKAMFRLRLHAGDTYFDFPFRLSVRIT